MVGVEATVAMVVEVVGDGSGGDSGGGGDEGGSK